MAKKTLEEKIHDVIFWMTIFYILYLIVGYLLESAWLSKPLKLSDVYDLLKDGLSITAAFLAPAAALILFSDWREEHHVKSMHTLIDEIKNLTQNIERSINKYLQKVYHPERLDTDEFMIPPVSIELLSEFINLSRLYLEFNAKDENSSIFKEHIKNFETCAKNARHALDMMDWASHSNKQIKVQFKGVERFEGAFEFHQKHFREHNIIFELNFQLISKLNEQIIIFGNLIKNNT